MGAVVSYLSGIREAVSTVFEGMAVSMSHMFRRPSTIQYPHHPRRPAVPIGGPETLPDRYRGFLEVDMDICTACLACMRACPINCINIDVEKVNLAGDPSGKPQRALIRFDIDMAKCMYCGLCQEPCPTNAIRHTKHFEAPVQHLEHLTVRFVDVTAPVVPFKVKKGDDYGSVEHGSIARRLLVDLPWDRGGIALPKIGQAAPKAVSAAPDPMSRPLSARAQSAAQGTVPQIVRMIVLSTPRTDCGACQYPTCKAFAEALVAGTCHEPQRCAPGGDDAIIEIAQILSTWRASQGNAAPTSGAVVPNTEDRGNP